jgi:hypothetical protein
MTAYLGMDRKCANPSMMAAYATVAGLTVWLENVGHKLYVGSLFL